MNKCNHFNAIVALEDGRFWCGRSFGAPGERFGELVFNTSLSGYQELLTDPSYHGQVVTMTYPLIGNYGINPQDMESAAIRVSGFVVREYCQEPSNWRSTATLQTWLSDHGVVAVEGVDTRAITRHLRTRGAMKCLITTTTLDPETAVSKAKASPSLVGLDFVKEVSTPAPYDWNDSGTYRVAVFDFGVKYNILRNLADHDCRVRVFPASVKAKDILAWSPDGIFLSNGPGDPTTFPYAVEQVKLLLGTKPIFGICMGHQVLGQVFGGSVDKLKFGHRGGNQPVRDETTGKVEITSQNHGFAVRMEGFPDPAVHLTHLNLNDRTCEGLAHATLPIFSVQYHPEAAPGPHDARYLFTRFVKMMATHGGRN